MSQLRYVLAGGVLGMLLAASAVRAQYPYQPSYGPMQRTQLSPYLNLLRGGNTAVNYYLGTIPEQQRRRQYSQLRTGIQNLDQQLRAAEAGRPDEEEVIPLSGGHPTYFMYYSHYYSLGRPAAARTGGGRPTVGQPRR